MGTEVDDVAEWDRVHSWTRSAFDSLAHEPRLLEERARFDEIRRDGELAAPLVDELRAIGIPLLDIGELGNVRQRYPAAVPILLKHLVKAPTEGLYLSIIRALAKDYGEVVFDALYEFLRARANSLSRSSLFAVGNALAANANRANLNDLIDVMRNPAYSLAHEPIALRIAKWPADRVRRVLLEYLDDPESPWTAIRALRLAKEWRAVDRVQQHANSSSAEVRNEVKRFIKAYERQQ